MSNFYNDLEIETVLQCPVCYEIPSKAIYLCKVGHHTCDKCRSRLTLCPTCQAPMTGSRNFLAEDLISKLDVLKSAVDKPQENKKSIAASTTTEQENKRFPGLPDNKNLLKPLLVPPGIYHCLLESCRNSKSGTPDRLYEHIQNKHHHIFDKNDSATFSHNFEHFCLMKNRHKFHRCFHVTNMGLFFLNIEVLRDHYINCWLSIPAPISMANKFYCQFQFSKENQETKYSLINMVASTLQSEEWLLERGRVFVISPYEHKLQYNDFFSLSVKIVFCPPGLKHNSTFV